MSEETIDREKAIFEYKGPDRIVHFTEFIQERKALASQPKYFSGWPIFDKKLDGIAPGELTTITGKTGEGKTLFAESWIRKMMISNSKMHACIFSFEVTPEILLQKHENSPTTPIFLPLELKAMDPDWLAARFKEAQIKYDCKIFLVDHLHFLVDMNTRQNLSLNIGAFMRQLKIIALDLKVSILLIAHQKGVPKGEEPSLENLRDSSFIGQESDNVLIVWRHPNFSSAEMEEKKSKTPLEFTKLSSRIGGNSNHDDKFSDRFAIVQIAKARRSGAFRVKKLFQKVGDFLEEV